MLWAHHRQDLENGVLLTRSAAPFVLWSATYDRTEDPLTGQKSKVSPDLYGKESLQCAGWFDFVCQMRAQTVGPERVNRWLTCKPDESALTRQRLRRAITRDIPIPAEKGGWEALLTAAIEAAK